MATYYELEDGTGVYILEDFGGAGAWAVGAWASGAWATAAWQGIGSGDGAYLLEEQGTGSLVRYIKTTESITGKIGTTMSVIRMSRGDSLNVVYTVKDENDAVVDLSGGSISWQAIRSGGTEVKIDKTGVLTDAVNGVTTIALVPADTINLGGTYALQGVHTDSGSAVYTFEDGALIVETDDLE